jgi:hypothetical protein
VESGNKPAVNLNLRGQPDAPALSCRKEEYPLISRIYRKIKNSDAGWEGDPTAN